MYCVVRTDHLPLTALFKRSNISGKFCNGPWKSNNIGEHRVHERLGEYVRGRSIQGSMRRPSSWRGYPSGALAGDFTARKVARELEKQVLWQGMKQDMAMWVKGCCECFRANPQALCRRVHDGEQAVRVGMREPPENGYERLGNEVCGSSCRSFFEMARSQCALGQQRGGSCDGQPPELDL